MNKSNNGSAVGDCLWPDKYPRKAENRTTDTLLTPLMPSRTKTESNKPAKGKANGKEVVVMVKVNNFRHFFFVQLDRSSAHTRPHNLFIVDVSAAQCEFLSPAPRQSCGVHRCV